MKKKTVTLQISVVCQCQCRCVFVGFFFWLEKDVKIYIHILLTNGGFERGRKQGGVVIEVLFFVFFCSFFLFLMSGGSWLIDIHIHNVLLFASL